MRLTSILLLVATALMASVDAVSKTAASGVSRYQKTVTKRLPGFNEDQDSEERAIISVGEMIKQATKAQIRKTTDSVRVPYWIREGKSKEAIFTRLKLNEGVDTILDNKKLATWFTFVKQYNKKHARDPAKQLSVTGMMSKTYGDDVVVRMLEIARDNPHKYKTANKLLQDFRKSWEKDQKDPTEVFKLLKLDKAGANLFSRREFNTWLVYTASVAKENPRETIVKILTEQLGADKLARVFAIAKPEDSELKILAVKLQTTMLKQWDDDMLSALDVFKLLKLNNGVGNIFANPVFETWMGYVGLISRHNGDQQFATMVKTFTSLYKTDDVARMLQIARNVEDTSLVTSLQVAQFKLWRREFRSPAVIAKTFNANDEVDDEIIRSFNAFSKSQ